MMRRLLPHIVAVSGTVFFIWWGSYMRAAGAQLMARSFDPSWGITCLPWDYG
jgi:hypothetical protein